MVHHEPTEKMTCKDCGRVYTYANGANHKKTKIHKELTKFRNDLLDKFKQSLNPVKTN